MSNALAALLAFAGVCVTGAVTWVLARRKSDADADSITVGTADKLVTLLRADMIDVRAQMVLMRGEIDALHNHVRVCEADNQTLREQVMTLRAENAGLHTRIDHLEADLAQRDGDGK